MRLSSNGRMTPIPGAAFGASSLLFDGSNFFETALCDACSGTLWRIPVSGAPAIMAWAGFAAVDDECAYFSSLQGYLDGGIDPQMGIFSVSKSYALCCDRSTSECSTSPCPAEMDAGSD
jgi:hypothetical protein